MGIASVGWALPTTNGMRAQILAKLLSLSHLQKQLNQYLLYQNKNENHYPLKVYFN